MKNTGITRPIDQLGRIVIPMELRKTFNLKEDDRMEIFVENDCIVLRKFQKGSQIERLISEMKALAKTPETISEIDDLAARLEAEENG
ncbi:MAG TPA: AbrB/MazE/SpoVT family DNA-binding domain-containing protein [Oscillospiraceae bacterium]|nr:AbrB/MazE/SpoVT family DNA-binding domain-containing protein [Oscillospiraceae bacterium]